jgi:hypothetical protein
VSQIHLDKADLQRALDWAYDEKKFPNKVSLKGDAQNLRIEFHDIDFGRYIPNISPDFTVSLQLDGQDLVVGFKGENLVSKFGGILFKVAVKLGRKLEGPGYEFESGDVARLFLRKIPFNGQLLGNLVCFQNVAWSNNRLELGFKVK